MNHRIAIVVAALVCCLVGAWWLQRSTSTSDRPESAELSKTEQALPNDDPTSPPSPASSLKVEPVPAAQIDAGVEGTTPTPRQAPRARFGEEIVDAEWAAAQERAVTGQLARLENPYLDVADVECRRSCCRVELDATWTDLEAADSRIVYNAVLLDLQSEVGFGAWSNGMELPGAGDLAFYACFDRSIDTLSKRGPDRIEERASLLEGSTAAFRSCAGKSGLFFVSVLLAISVEGLPEVRQVAGGDEYPEVVECIREVLLTWRFEPAPVPGFLPIPLFIKDS